MEVKEPAAEPSPVNTAEGCLGHDEQCPLCGRDNHCRVAKGHLYKGPCWCHEIIVPNRILTRLAVDRLEPACLCRPCLETIARISREEENPEIVLREVQRIVALNEDTYLDSNGNKVFTEAYHLKRGACCDNGCRHCPY
jgi:hypothetical protein